MHKLILRRHALLAAWGLLTTAITACGPNEKNHAKRTMHHSADQETFYFNVNLYSYLERPIFDVFLNKKFIGDAAGQPHRGSGGIITGVPVRLGAQTITWRDSETGEGFQAVNSPIIENIDPHLSYLGVHIYPDNTAELTFEEFWPEKTPRGEEINRQWELQNGQ